MKKFSFFIVFMGLTAFCQAQMHEAGVFFGGSNLVGDLGAPTFLKPNGSGLGLVYKFNKNPRIAYRATFTQMNLRANAVASKTEILTYFQDQLDKKLNEVTLGIEFNFLAHHVFESAPSGTPYFVFELAAFQFKTATELTENPLRIDRKSKRGLAIPFGMGYKLKFHEKFAFAIEARARYTFTDELDDSQFVLENNTIGATNDNVKYHNPKTNDWYFFSGASIVYTFGSPSCCSKPKRR